MLLPRTGHNCVGFVVSIPNCSQFSLSFHLSLEIFVAFSNLLHCVTTYEKNKSEPFHARNVFSNSFRIYKGIEQQKNPFFIKLLWQPIAIVFKNVSKSIKYCDRENRVTSEVLSCL